MSACTWIFKTDVKTMKFFFSYANKNEDNALLLGDFSDGLGMDIYRHRLVSKTTTPIHTWSQVCFTWDNTFGDAAIYLNGEKIASGNIAKGVVIRGDGIINLGQEQDKVGGGFSTGQAFSGSTYNFNLFDRALSEAEVLQMQKFCSLVDKKLEKDVVVSWATIVSVEPHGAAVFDQGDDAWLHGAPTCQKEETNTKDCSWEKVEKKTIIGIGSEIGDIAGFEAASVACNALNDCVAMSCNEKGNCWLKSSKDRQRSKKGVTTYIKKC